MRLFSKLYDRVISWSRYKHAPYYLGAVSFIESSLFPIPPDIMLAPMALAKPEAAWRYAAITTVASVIGALFGYTIGLFFFQWIAPYLDQLGYIPAYHQVQVWFAQWGGWVLFMAGFTPIPFKLFTIGAGSLHMNLLVFFLGSLAGRSLRFYLVSGLMKWGGATMDTLLRKSVDWIGWIVIALMVITYGIYTFYK